MIKWLIGVLWGDSCSHDWDVITTTKYTHCDKLLLVCNKCGKITKRRV